MGPVLLAVAEVIEDVKGAGDHAEGEKGPGRFEQQGEGEEFPGEDQGREDEQVLGPLGRPHRPDDGTDGHGELALFYTNKPRDGNIRRVGRKKAYGDALITVLGGYILLGF
jgi:hypothetical protein